MAQRVSVEWIDDFDGSEAAETVTFGLDGAQYEIDLSESNAEALRGALGTYLAVARRVGGRRTGKRVSGGRNVGTNPRDIREWARANRYDVPDRGRIPAEIREAYTASSR